MALLSSHPPHPLADKIENECCRSRYFPGAERDDGFESQFNEFLQEYILYVKCQNILYIVLKSPLFVLSAMVKCVISIWKSGDIGSERGVRINYSNSGDSTPNRPDPSNFGDRLKEVENGAYPNQQRIQRR